MKKFIWLALISLMLLLPTTILADDYKPIGGTHLSLIPAKTFEESRTYPGFQSTLNQISFSLIDEYPLTKPGEGISFVEKSVTAELFKSQGLTLKSTQKNFIKGVNSILFKCTLEANSVEYTQWVYYVEGPGFIAQIHVTAASDSFKKLENDILAMLKSLKWSTKLHPANLYYKITTPKGWTMIKRQGLTELYTENGKQMQTLDDSYVMVNRTNITIPKKDRDAAIDGFIKSASPTAPKILKDTLITIDGQEAHIVILSIYEAQLAKDIVYQSCYIFYDNFAVSIVANQTKTFTTEDFERVVKSFKVAK